MTLRRLTANLVLWTGHLLKWAFYTVSLCTLTVLVCAYVWMAIKDFRAAPWHTTWTLLAAVGGAGACIAVACLLGRLHSWARRVKGSSPS